ncbi:MAG TPA: hypothetical protein VK983_04585 [Candidatus Limnocylindrales bacterium]|nr:hypothetical protein [Candidatus Limnocylindrales bacterium]
MRTRWGRSLSSEALKRAISRSVMLVLLRALRVLLISAFPSEAGDGVWRSGAC